MRREPAPRQPVDALLGKLAEASPDVTYVVDVVTRRLIYLSPAYENVWGEPRDAVLRDIAHWDGTIHPEDREEAVAGQRRMYEPGARTVVAEYRIVRPDGQTRHVRDTAVPVRDGDGRLRHVAGVAHDVTALRQAEELLASQDFRVETLAARRSSELRRAQETLNHARRMEALGQLAGGVAHDFNNVLQAVHGAFSMILRRVQEPDAIRRMAQLGVEAADRGAAVTRRLLAFSRREQAENSRIEVPQMLQGLQEILRHTLGSQVVVELDVAGDLPVVTADRSQLETVLVNLAINARDAMPDGGRLTLRAREELAGGDGHGRPSFVCVCVEDTGTGMDPEVAARATEPFFTTKPEGSGTGLGLALAREFAAMSGGSLMIETERGRGTTVSLRLPTMKI